MLSWQVFCVALASFVVVHVSSEPTRPNYLTEEDFARSALLPPIIENGTILNLPHNDMERTIETKNAWRHSKWPGGRVPYTIDPNLNDTQRNQVYVAFNNYQWVTCVRFVPKESGDNDYVHISRDDTTCGFASVCKSGGAQFAKFGGSCINSGVMTHELGHTLCFGHEQSRSDRDKYISWNTNICQATGIDSANDWTTLGLFYDYCSIQHYEDECYNGCIKPKISGVTKCGSGGTLSVLDVEKINAFYNCGGCYSYRFRPISELRSDEVLVEAGKDVGGETLYICRAYVNGDIVPGKGNVAYKECHVGYKGLEYRITENFEILTNPQRVKLEWKPHSTNSWQFGAIPTGRTAEREPLYTGRCNNFRSEDGRVSTIPGKIQRSLSSFREMYVAFAGREYKCENFDILVCV